MKIQEIANMTVRERNERLLKDITPIREKSTVEFQVGETVTVLSVSGTPWKEATVLEIPMEGWRILSTIDGDWIVRKATDLTN